MSLQADHHAECPAPRAIRPRIGRLRARRWQRAV